MADLKDTRDTLHALALYLLETAARAQLAGSTTLVVQTQNFTSMAQTVFQSVIALEGILGGQTPTSPPTPSDSPSSGSSGSNFDASAYMKQLTEQIQAQTQEMQRKAFEEIKKQYDEEMQKLKTVTSTPITPPPPVQG